MKKVFIIVFLVLLTLCISAAILNKENLTTQQNKTSDSNTENVAEDTDNTQEYVYIPIPEDKKAQYKNEVTQVINKEYPVAINETQQIRDKAHKMYLEVLKDKKLYMDYATSNFDIIISTGEFNLLSKIIDITDKYVKIKDEEALATDYNGAILDFLNPYFIDNNINTEKLDELGIFIHKNYNEIIQEEEHLHKIIYPDENY